MSPLEEADGHGCSEPSLRPVIEDGVMEDAEKPTSSEQDASSVGGDQGLGGSGPARKRKKGTMASADENGSATKRVLRSDAVKLRMAIKAVGRATADVSKGDTLDRIYCKDATVEVDRSEVLTTDSCNGGGETGKVIEGRVSETVKETARSSLDDVECSDIATIEIAEENGFSIEGNTEDSATHEDNMNYLVHGRGITKQNVHEDTISSPVYEGSSVNQNKSRVETTTVMIIDEYTRKVESVEQKDTALHTEGLVMHDCGIQKVEVHCHADDAKKETKGSLIENGCSTENQAMQINGIKQKEEMGSLEKENKGAAAPDIVFTRRKSFARKICDPKQVNCDKVVRFEKRVTRSATARQEVGSGSTSNITNQADSERKEKIYDILPGDMMKGIDPLFLEAHHKEPVEYGVDTKRQIFNAKTADQRDAGVTENDYPAETTENKDMEAERKINLKLRPLTRSRSGNTVKKTTEDAVSAVDENVCSSPATERDDTDLTDSEGVKSQSKTALQKTGLSVGAKIVASKKRIMELGVDKICGGSEAGTPTRKKTKTTSSDSDLDLDQPIKSVGRKLTGKNCGSDKKSITLKQQHSCPKVDMSRPVKRRNKKASKLSENESDDLDAETDSDTSYRKTRSGHCRAGVPVVLKKEEDSSESEEVIIMEKGRQKGKSSGKKHGAGTTSKYSSRASRTSRFRRSHSTRSEFKSLSQQAEQVKVKSPKGKNMVYTASSMSSSNPSKQTSAGGIREAKQKISEQIKGMLLDAGWKIDLRPRNGRNYLDSVYIPPSGKGSYWSVTKAYSVLLHDMETEQKGKTKSQSSSKASKGSPGEGNTSTFCSLPESILSKLKRIVINKRRSKAELQKLKKNKRGILKKFKGSKGKLKEKKNKISRRLHLGRERKKQGGCALLARGSNQEDGNSTDGFVPYEWKRTVFSWLIDLDILSVSTKVKYMDENHSKVLLEGLVTRDGINCSCCSKVLPVLEFVAHAGGEMGKPYRNILIDGLEVDLLHCLKNAWDKQPNCEKQAFFPVNTDGDDPNDDTCGICGDGGDLICCDGCPSTFHMSCLGIEALPSDDWCCANCSCKFCQEHSSPDVHEIAEVDSSLLACSQCGEKYHKVCSPEIDRISSVSSPLNNLFCQQSCRQLFEGLQNLLAVKKDLEAGFSCRIIQRVDEDLPETVLGQDERVECNSKLAVALALMDECFLPIVDQRTGMNLIHNVVYNCGSNFVRLDFRGFYTFILECGDEIISAASVRIHGTKLAEMPFIGTRNMYRKQGMCRRLLYGIEMILCSLKIEKLVIPAITELVDAWTHKFGFRPLEVSHKQEVKSISMLVFPGTGLLQKPLLDKASAEKHTSLQAVLSADLSGQASHVANEDSLCSIANDKPQDSKLTDSNDGGRDAATCNGDVSHELTGASCGSRTVPSEDKSLDTAASEEHIVETVKTAEPYPAHLKRA